MKPPAARVRRAAAKRLRVTEGSGAGERAPAPKRPAAQASPPPERRAPPAEPDVDLTADTPPEGASAEREETEVAPALVAPAPAEGEETGAAPDAPAPAEVADWGEGPSGAASPPPAPGSARDIPLAEPQAAESTDGGGTDGAQPGPSQGPSLEDGHRAERLLSGAILPETLEELSQLKSGAFFRDSYLALFRLLNSLAAAREVIRGGKTLYRQSIREAEEARTQAQVAQTQAGEALAQAEGARAQAEEARARAEEAERALAQVGAERAEEARAAAERSEAEARRLSAALDQLMGLESAIAARDLHISELGSALRDSEERAQRAEEEAVRAREAGKARETDLEASVGARVAQAVEEFRASEEFAAEVVEANAESYAQGFREAREKVARVFSLPAALEVVPDEDPAETPSDDEAARDSQP